MTDEKRESAPPENKNLRDRIAAVLNANLPVMEYLRPGDTEYAADAVIRELGLTESDGVIVGCSHD